MSFVLDAMNKHAAGNDPDAAAARARATARASRQRLWVGLFAAAMAANLALVVWIFGVPYLDARQRTPAPVIAPVAAPQATIIAPVGVPRATLAPTPGLAATPPATAPAPRREPSPAPSPPPAETRPPGPQRVSLGQLPADVRQRFPGIAFSTHIYADDADLRAIVANGERLQEGDRVRGLEIRAITEAGVVLAFESYLVEVPLSADWD